MSIITRTDSYKASHYLQYPPKTTSTHFYLESRGGKFAETKFFGLQYILKKYFSDPITQLDVCSAERRFVAHGVPFNREGWDYIVQHHGGRLPLAIRAVPEGNVYPVHTPLLTVENTDPRMFWLPGYVETVLQRVWYPTTVCTLSHEIKKVIRKALEATSDAPEAELPWKLHDFGARGVSSAESAGIGDCAHLVNFRGTDTIEGLELADEFYGCKNAGESIPAAEHSTMTSWGRDGEVDACRNMLIQFAEPGKLVAVVSDSYDIWNCIDNIWGKELRQQVIDSGATLVIRPDSGDPQTMVVTALKKLDAAFGHTVNSKGYKVLNHVRVIQGDGVDLETIQNILIAIQIWGYSASNVAFGSGGALLQKLDRDTQKFAYKCSSAVVDGVRRDVFKDPVTDPGKKSRCGIQDHPDMCTVWEYGKLLVYDTLDTIRARGRS